MTFSSWFLELNPKIATSATVKNTTFQHRIEKSHLIADALYDFFSYNIPPTVRHFRATRLPLEVPWPSGQPLDNKPTS